MPNTKIDVNHNKISRIQSLDEFAQVIFPGNKKHQKIFLSIFIELKYTPNQFMPNLDPLCDKYGYTVRMLETVRSKMRRMGIIDHVSRFNKAHGYREGWVFSGRFSRALKSLGELCQSFRNKRDALQEKRDRVAFRYL